MEICHPVGVRGRGGFDHHPVLAGNYPPQPFRFPHLTFSSQLIVPLPIKSVDRNWIKDHPSIDDIARFCQPALPLSEIFEDPWDPRQVHFLITAKAPADG